MPTYTPQIRDWQDSGGNATAPHLPPALAAAVAHAAGLRSPALHRHPATCAARAAATADGARPSDGLEAGAAARRAAAATAGGAGPDGAALHEPAAPDCLPHRGPTREFGRVKLRQILRGEEGWAGY